MKPNRELLERVATHVLEEAAFLFAQPLGGRPPADEAWTATGARLRFAGPLRGYVELWVPERIARLMAANMLGEESDAPDAEASCLDALRETLNILCGNLLTALAGEEPVFQLGTPDRCDERHPFQSRELGVDAWLEADGQPLLTRLAIHTPAPQTA